MNLKIMNHEREGSMRKQDIRSIRVIKELKRIAAKHAGLLRAEDVVEAARPEDSPLHKRFTWNDGEAAHLWRLEEARRIIRVTVRYIKVGKKRIPIRVFVSLTPDRDDDGGGYRSTVDVLSRSETRQQFLRDACAEMESFKDKYKSIRELSEVFLAMTRAGRTLLSA